MSRSRPYDSAESRRSPRERSPAPQRYPESRESGQQRGAPYRANDIASRPSTDLRLSNDAFPSNRDSPRDGANRQAPRDHVVGLVPPRAPKAFSDAPTGPRAIFAPESNPRGGGRGRGRGWHDDVRDRGRDSEYDYRDRRDARGAPSFRGDRGREREWMDRDRRDRDGSSFRGRRPSSPGAGYSRGRGRVRGDWDSRGHGRGYDDRDRFRGRSRSPPPSRRASVASPPPQAPEVPAFGTVINHAPLPPSVPDNQQISSTTSVSIPTGPRSTRDQTALKNWQPPAVRVQSYGVPQWSRSSSVTQPPEPLTASAKPTKSTAVADLVAKKTADSSPVPGSPPNSHATPVMIRLPLPRDDIFEDDDSDSESGEDMDDFFEAETQKVVDQLAQTSLGDVDRSFTYASQDPVSLFPILEPPDKISDDGNEVESHEMSALPCPIPQRLAMPEYQPGGDETDAEYQEEQLAAVRSRMKTPPMSSLPFETLKQKWYENEEFLREIEESAKHQSILEEELAEEWRKKEEHREHLKEEYAAHYKRYLEFCDSNDPAAVNYRARIASNEKATSRAASLTPAAEGRPEGRRAVSRWATEHDMARVLQESKREAQEKQERAERAAKAKAATEKEAIIPDMMSLEEYRRECFTNTSRLVPFDRAPAILGILPPVDNFTEEESEIFEKTYLDFPKQWSKIATALPGRDYKNCIQHYYLVKHKDSLKEKLKKKEKGKKKGRATAAASKPRSNALMANLGSRDGETDDGQDTADGERRRPRRAAAPIWPIEQPSESETATPAPTPGRRMASTNKGDTGSESGPTKRKNKSSGREKGPKQPKNGQLLAAAPPPKPRDVDDNQSSTQIIEKARGKTPSDSHRYFPQVDGAAPAANAYLPPRPPNELVAGPPSGGIDKVFQTFTDGEYGESPPVGVTFDLQHNDRRNANTTSSYWSVPEQTDFPALLQHFGTDWHAIAKHMASKTHIMVKNYYQRQIDSGRQDLEELSKNADARRARGEPTGPPPTPTVPIKRRYDGPAGALHRSNVPTVETAEELLPNHHMIIPNASSPKPAATPRFPTLAQASPAPQTTQPTRTISTSTKPSPSQSQPQQWVQQVLQHPQQNHRGPQLGFFNHPDRERPLMQATSTQPPVGLSDPHRIQQRSEIVAYEAQLERDQAMRLQEQQIREQQAQNQQAREQHQQAREQHARQQRQRLGEQPVRRQQHSMKSEAEMQNLSQYEQYSTQGQQPSILARSRIEEPSSMYGNDPRRSAPAASYATRDPQVTREIGSEIIAATTPGLVSSTQPQLPRTTMTAVHTNQDTPPMAPRPQPPPAVAAVRQQETVRKTSSIMSLLNEEPSDPRPPPTKRNSDGPLPPVQQASLPATTQPLFPPSRSLSSGQSSQIRRKTSIGDIQSLTNNYSRPQSSSQGSIRVVESPYSAISHTQAQAQAQAQARSQVSSTLDAHPVSDRDSYAHQPYGMSRTQPNSTNSPQSGPQYQPTQPVHHQMAFAQSSKRTASPPGQYPPVPGSRNSFEYSHHITPSSVPVQMQYSSGPPVSGGYQPAPQTHHSISSVRFPPSSYSPSYEARESFRPNPPQRPNVDRLQTEQQQHALIRQQMLHQQQQQQQLQRDELYHQRRPEERRYEESRRG